MAPLLKGLTVQGTASARFRIDGREYINFYGSGYLALGGIAELKQQRSARSRRVPRTRAKSRAPMGLSIRKYRTSNRLRPPTWAAQSALYFASGYFAGAVALGSMDTSQSALFIDENAHFSLFEAAQLTGRPTIRFAHCDPQALLSAIQQQLPPRNAPIVLTDGVFATTGALAPLDQYASAIENYGGHLVVDEAHSFGVIGLHGRGAADHFGVEGITIGRDP